MQNLALKRIGMKTFKDIIAWQKAYQLTLELYKQTAEFPRSEEFGLRSQLRRASVSIISNIAEGFRKTSLKEKIYFYKISECSLEEVKCQTMLAHDLGYFETIQYKKIKAMEDEAGKVLNGWIASQK